MKSTLVAALLIFLSFHAAAESERKNYQYSAWQAFPVGEKQIPDFEKNSLFAIGTLRNGVGQDWSVLFKLTNEACESKAFASSVAWKKYTGTMGPESKKDERVTHQGCWMAGTERPNDYVACPTDKNWTPLVPSSQGCSPVPRAIFKQISKTL